MNNINPDEFLNLNEFLENTTESVIKLEDTFDRYTVTNHSPSQLTPPISPKPDDFTDFEEQIHSANIIPTRKHLQSHPCSVTKVKLIVPKPSSSSESDSNTIVINNESSSFTNDKASIKQQRQIRNRESAILSRNKKKEYLETLEAQNVQLRNENLILKAENAQLRQEFNTFTNLQCRCAGSIKRKLPSRNATVLLVVLFMVGVNVFPFRNFAKKSLDELNETEKFDSRHLLFVENSSMYSESFTSNNDTKATETEEENLIYLNQTDQIRKFNIDNIKRWIPEPDLYNVSHIKKDFDFNPDPLQEKLTKMYEKSREQSKKYAKNSKNHSTKKLIGPIKRPVQLYNPNNNVIKLNEFFDEINRKDDTFYVFSFKSDHLLLPAIENSYNFSQIKMNLIMPKNNISKFDHH